jgi:hypothetical protein
LPLGSVYPRDYREGPVRGICGQSYRPRNSYSVLIASARDVAGEAAERKRSISPSSTVVAGSASGLYRERLSSTARTKRSHLRLVVVEVDTGGTGASNPRAGRSSAASGRTGRWSPSGRAGRAWPGIFAASSRFLPQPNMLGPYILGIQGSMVDFSPPCHG